MTKEVVVSVKGLQFNGDTDGDEIETISPGQYYKKGDGHYVIYEEVAEESGEVTRNLIHFHDNQLDLGKKGYVNAHMIFEENKKTISSYVTPYGELMFGIDAQKIEFDEKDDHILIQVDYVLEVNYEFLADCKIILEIRPKAESGPMILS